MYKNSVGNNVENKYISIFHMKILSECCNCEIHQPVFDICFIFAIIFCIFCVSAINEVLIKLFLDIEYIDFD